MSKHGLPADVRMEFSTIIEIEVLKIKHEVHGEELRANLRWEKIKEIDKILTEQAHIEKEAFIEEYFPILEEKPEPTKTYSTFMHLALNGPEINEEFLNYVAVAKKRAPTKKRGKTHEHQDGKVCTKADCFDREIKDFVIESL